MTGRELLQILFVPLLDCGTEGNTYKYVRVLLDYRVNSLTDLDG